MTKDWERQFRDVLSLTAGRAGMPPLNQEEIESRVAREKSIRRWVNRARSHAAIDDLSRLLFGDGQTEDQIKELFDCHPLKGKDASHGIILYCLLRIQPLNHWPADVIRVLGRQMIHQPFVAGAILQLAEIARDPRTFVNRIKPELFPERGLRASISEAIPNPDPEQAELRITFVRIARGDPEVIKKLNDLPAALVAKILADDYEPQGLADFARKQVLRVTQLLVARSAPKTKSRRRIRTLKSFEAKRQAGLSEKKAVADIAREEGRPDSAVRADIQHAREELGLRSRTKRRREPHHRIS